MFLRFLVPALPLAFPLTAQSQVFRVDDNHTVLGFKASTLLFDVPGRFTRYGEASEHHLHLAGGSEGGRSAAGPGEPHHAWGQP